MEGSGIPAGRPPLLFDRQDFELVDLVNEFASRGADTRPERLRRLLSTYLHPRGIKELAATRQRRIAYAVIRLLDSLDSTQAQDRLMAVEAVYDELVQAGNQGIARNTGRVLFETMKHLVRSRGNYWEQVELAHQFLAAASGRPVVVRDLLAQNHLLEMPEAWNQIAFDHHVHDANTKGRKSPTHLVVDAWTKGIRDMTVIYYRHTRAETITELLEAARIVGMRVQAGIEVAARLRGKQAQLIWVPRGLESVKEYVEFLALPRVQAFFDLGREVTRHQTASVLQMLDVFNQRHLAAFNAEQGVELKPLDRDEFLHFVGVGQPSRSHLAEYVHLKLVEAAGVALPELRRRWGAGEDRPGIDARVASLDRLTPDDLASTWLSYQQYPDVPDPHLCQDGPDVPELLRKTTAEMIAMLKELRAGSAITLNPSGLTPADVLEVLHDGGGAITHIEIFNLKDFQRNKAAYGEEIATIRRIVNEGNPIPCKRMIRDLIRQEEQAPAPDGDRLAKLHAILADIPRLLSWYATTPIGSRLGSDSVGRARSWAGMGLAVTDTLPRRAVREFRRHPGTREVIPFETSTVLRTTWVPHHRHVPFVDAAYRLIRRVPGLRQFGYEKREEYVVVPNTTRPSTHGNILTLGGMPENPSNGLALKASPPPGPGGFRRWGNLSTGARNVLKIAIGFVPALLTFLLTKDWWVLAYFGAFIWFGITGVRNVLQSIFGGGGLARSEHVRWTDLVSWDRIADSLLYTGFSVPLLDWLVKSLLLDRGFGITTTTAPLALYGVMGVVNGLYLFTHNTFRGLPRGAAVGNFFRSVLSIPVAFGLNALAFEVMVGAGLDSPAANVILQAWAAVIGKLASDTVAAIIEGTADRSVNAQRRHQDYGQKLRRLLQVHGQIEALFPEIDVVETLASPKEFFRTLGREAAELERQQVINALDLMYFWFYQPCARQAFRVHLEAATPEERRIILLTQRLLERQRPISEMFLDDLVGKNFSPPLAFYLGRSAAYLREMRALADVHGVSWTAAAPQ